MTIKENSIIGDHLKCLYKIGDMVSFKLIPNKNKIYGIIIAIIKSNIESNNRKILLYKIKTINNKILQILPQYLNLESKIIKN